MRSKHLTPRPQLSRSQPFQNLLACAVITISGALVTSSYAAGQTPTAHFSGVESSFALPFVNYGGIVSDSAGDTFFADDTNDQIVEFKADGTRTTLPTYGAEPEYLAIDSAGNLYVTCTNRGAVLKYPINTTADGQAGQYQYPLLIAYNGLQTPWGIAVDSTGNVFVADHATGAIYKLASQDGVSYTMSTFLQTGILNGPVQIAHGPNDALYVADRGNNRIVVISPNGSIRFPFQPVPSPNGVAFDAGTRSLAVTNSSNLYYLQLPAGASYTSANFKVLSAGFQAAFGVAVDTTGTPSVVDSRAQKVVRHQIIQGTYQFGTFETYLSPIVQAVLVFDTPTNLTTGPQLTIGTDSTATTITPNFFGDQDGTTCILGQHYAAGQSCIEGIQFDAVTTGVYSGLIELMSSNQRVVAAIPVQGEYIDRPAPSPHPHIPVYQ